MFVKSFSHLSFPRRRESRKNLHEEEGPAVLGMNKQFYVYILASRRNGTLYTGMSSNLLQRVWQHKNNMVEGFSDKYNTKDLVYFEVHDSAESAIIREKQIKKWRRKWKLRLIEEQNLRWEDLYSKISKQTGFPPSRE